MLGGEVTKSYAIPCVVTSDGEREWVCVFSCRRRKSQIQK